MKGINGQMSDIVFEYIAEEELVIDLSLGLIINIGRKIRLQNKKSYLSRLNFLMSSDILILFQKHFIG